MENSSKALLIAGGVLIAVLILSLFVYLYMQMHNFSSEYNSNIDSQKIQAFNTQFAVYNGRDDLTAQDIVTVASMAREYNENNNDKIVIKVGSTYTIENLIGDNKFDFIVSNQKNSTTGEIVTFTCDEIKYSQSTGKIIYIHFIKNN